MTFIYGALLLFIMIFINKRLEPNIEKMESQPLYFKLTVLAYWLVSVSFLTFLVGRGLESLFAS